MRTALTAVAVTLGILAGLLCIGAGVYMLLWRFPAPEGMLGPGPFALMQYAVGVYMIGRGLGLAARAVHVARDHRP